MYSGVFWSLLKFKTSAIPDPKLIASVTHEDADKELAYCAYLSATLPQMSI